MCPTIAAAPLAAGSDGSPGDEIGDQDGGGSLGDVERHHDDAAPRARRAQHVGRADVAAAGDAHIDPGATRQQVGERNRTGEVAEQHRKHQLNGTRSSGVYVDPFGESRLSKSVTAEIRVTPASTRRSRRMPRTREPADRGSIAFTRAIVRCAAKGRRSGPEPERRQAFREFTVKRLHRLRPALQPYPEDPRRPRRRKCSQSGQPRIEDGPRKRRREGVLDCPGALVAHVPDEPERQVEVFPRNPARRDRNPRHGQAATKRGHRASAAAAATPGSSSTPTKSLAMHDAPAATRGPSVRRTMSSAACVAQNLTCARGPTNENVRTMAASGDETAIATVPTGFCGVPPPGPAIPVIPTPMLAPVRARIPSARATATGSLTAPCAAMSPGATSANSVFESLL